MSTNRDDFYVGYLPVPASYRGTIKSIVVGIVLGFAALAGLSAIMQRDPGKGVWSDVVTEHTGFIRLNPAPMLLHQDGAAWRAMLLIEEGKLGAQARAASWEGKAVTVRGKTLMRDGRSILELVPGQDAIVPAALATPPDVPRAQLGTVTLRGEIIDPKCYHGAMKPGEGKTHKACATLCIGNGIPPMFASNTDQGTAFHLITMEGGGPLDQDSMSKIGEAVEVSGEASTFADLTLITITPGSVKRLKR